MSRDAAAHTGWRRRRRRTLVAVAVAMGLSAWAWNVGLLFDGPVPTPSTSISAVSGPDDWGMIGRDAAHTSAVDGHQALEGRIAWRFESPALWLTPPAIADGRVYLATGDGSLVSLDAGDGSVVWEREVPVPTAASPAVTASHVYLTARNGRMLAISRDGEPAWEFRAGGPFSTAVVVYQGVAYAGSADGTLYAVDAVDGRLLWSMELEGRVTSAPSMSGDLLAVAADDRLIYLIDVTTGKKRMVFATPHLTATSPVFADERVLISTRGGTLTGLDSTKLEYPMERAFRDWRQQLFLWGMQSGPPVPKGFVWGRLLGRGEAASEATVLDGVAYVALSEGRLRAIAVADGTPLWTYEAGATVHTAPSVAGNLVYVGSEDGAVHVVDRHAGGLRQSFDVGTRMVGPVVATATAVYVMSSESATLMALR